MCNSEGCEGVENFWGGKWVVGDFLLYRKFGKNDKIGW